MVAICAQENVPLCARYGEKIRKFISRPGLGLAFWEGGEVTVFEPKTSAMQESIEGVCVGGTRWDRRPACPVLVGRASRLSGVGRTGVPPVRLVGRASRLSGPGTLVVPTGGTPVVPQDACRTTGRLSYQRTPVVPQGACRTGRGERM